MVSNLLFIQQFIK